MKEILGTSIVPTSTIVIFIILFLTLGILLSTTSLPQFIYAQTVENEIIENTLETVEEATPDSLEITKPFQLENITSNLNNGTAESAITTEEDVIQGTEEAIKSETNDSDPSSENQYGSSTLEEQLKLAQERLNQLGLVGSYNTNNSNTLKIDLGFPPVDFSKMFEDIVGSFIDVEYQSASSVILRGDEETLLLLNGTLAPFWYAIDIVKKTWISTQRNYRNRYGKPRKSY
jgi:hypothetical protein